MAVRGGWNVLFAAWAGLAMAAGGAAASPPDVDADFWALHDPTSRLPPEAEGTFASLPGILQVSRERNTTDGTSSAQVIDTTRVALDPASLEVRVTWYVNDHRMETDSNNMHAGSTLARVEVCRYGACHSYAGYSITGHDHVDGSQEQHEHWLAVDAEAVDTSADVYFWQWDYENGYGWGSFDHDGAFVDVFHGFAGVDYQSQHRRQEYNGAMTEDEDVQRVDVTVPGARVVVTRTDDRLAGSDSIRVEAWDFATGWHAVEAPTPEPAP